ncbi:hypothetical protein B0T11DRAFT_17104 [Plectosphaerella cucumerina]|uniref:SPX domain-containing protein n=1 Tax=Plectosphaerella cucumerina TaxID=40658 RepID=A0A8K0X992_9PEZI|nr:hypothetical protein B0T11DRAFT_17104 [Plectosphaerella cucumerina]
MKYGDQLEEASVPEWSLHNIDYNALKHEIKVHTTRSQATAMAIPGQQDHALQKFEDRLYLELCNQHDRVDLFVSSKADEIHRRLESLSDLIGRLIDKCDGDGSPRVSLKRQRRFSKYERDLLRCEEEILALSRFIKAQAEAFRKITKKYKKWTGSPNLGVRFRENVLWNPKSFVRRDFTHLQNRYEEVMRRLRDSTAHFSEPSSPSTAEPPSPRMQRERGVQEGSRPPRFLELPPPQAQYWNEYDNGSDRGDDEYAIYIDPDADDSFPGLNSVRAIIRRPLQLATSWFSSRDRTDDDTAHRPLLSSEDTARGAPYGGISPFNNDTDEDIEYASSEENLPFSGFAGYYALPSVNEQRVERYREEVLSWSTIGAFAASFVLLAVASILLATGRHRLRVEVDAGVTVGVVASLFCACVGLGAMMLRTGTMSIMYQAAVWTTFVASCVFNGMLLILVVGNAA